MANRRHTDQQIQALIAGDALGSEDAAFKEFVGRMPDKHWARKDVSAVRLGWEAHKEITLVEMCSPAPRG